MELSLSFENLDFKDYISLTLSCSPHWHTASENPMNATNLKQMTKVYCMRFIYNNVQKLGLGRLDQLTG
jgi:hypothetical protein